MSGRPGSQWPMSMVLPVAVGSSSATRAFWPSLITSMRSAFLNMAVVAWRALCSLTSRPACWASSAALGSVGWSTSAPRPADSTALPGRPALSMASATGLRQMLPVQSTSMRLNIRGLVAQVYSAVTQEQGGERRHQQRHYAVPARQRGGGYIHHVAVVQGEAVCQYQGGGVFEVELVHVDEVVAVWRGVFSASYYEHARGVGLTFVQAAYVGDGFGQCQAVATHGQGRGFTHFAQYEDFLVVAQRDVDHVAALQQHVMEFVALFVNGFQ